MGTICHSIQANGSRDESSSDPRNRQGKDFKDKFVSPQRLSDAQVTQTLYQEDH